MAELSFNGYQLPFSNSPLFRNRFGSPQCCGFTDHNYVSSAELCIDWQGEAKKPCKSVPSGINNLFKVRTEIDKYIGHVQIGTAFY
jgi:hypothetical protein